MRHHRNRLLLNHVGVGLFNERSQPRQRLAPPITQRRDARIDQREGEASPCPSAEPLCPLFMAVVARPSLEYRWSTIVDSGEVVEAFNAAKLLPPWRLWLRLAWHDLPPTPPAVSYRFRGVR